VKGKFKQNKNGKFESRYTEAFKRKVIKEYLETGTPKMRLLIKYGITYNTISHYRSTQRCAAIFPIGGMKHSQDDMRRSLRPPDGGRDDLLGEVMRKKSK